MAQQTAVDWLAHKVNSDCLNSIFIRPELIEQAKQMEKERVVNFCFECLIGDNIHTIKSNKELLEYIEQYYNETYNK
jgi:hypothetical protein